MKTFRMTAIAIAVLVSAASCDKDDNDNSTPPTLSRIQAKWSVTSKIMDKAGTTVGDSTYTGVAADYMDFKTDNKVYWQLKNVKDTAAYSLTNDSTLVLDGTTSKISKLSSSEFIVKQTIVGTAKDTTYVTFNLKK